MTSSRLEREVLRDHYASLTTTVRDIDNLLPHFVTAGIINDDDMDEIKAITRASDKVIKLLKFISGTNENLLKSNVCLPSLNCRSFRRRLH